MVKDYPGIAERYGFIGSCASRCSTSAIYKNSRGDEKNTIIRLIFSYIAVLAIIPIAGLIFIGENIFEPTRLIIFFLEIIIGPIIISQLTRRLKFDKYVLKYRRSLINWRLKASKTSVIKLII